MTHSTLTLSEREALQDVVKRARDAQLVRRAQALLWRDEGEAVSAIATRLHVSRQTIYNWLHAFTHRQSLPLHQRLQDAPRSGRPATQRQRIEALVRRLWERRAEQIDTQPAAVRTAVALQRQLVEDGAPVHERTIRRVLRSLHYRFKRPRYVLARRSSTWRQQKGG